MLKHALITRFGPLLVALAFAVPAAAQEVCVTCSDPDVSYKCSVKDSEKASQIRGAGKAIEFLCITELARAGGHRSCRASRDYVGPCLGQQRVIDVTRPSEPPVQGQQADGDAAETDGTIEARRNAANQVPRTLEEMARESAAKSKQQLDAADQSMKQAAKDAGKTLDKAGAAVGDAVKKTGTAVGDAVKKTGTAVGDAVQKSGDVVKKSVVCIVTLFTSCGQNEPEK